MNGKIEAVTRSYVCWARRGSQRSSPSSRSAKAQTGSACTPSPERPASPSSSCSATRIARTALRASTLHASDGRTIRLRNTITGEVGGTYNSTGGTLGGWAANLQTRRAATSIVVFVNGRSVFAGENGNTARGDIADRYGVQQAGFIFRLPGSTLPAAHRGHSVRVLAIEGNVASELRYLPGYPWKTQ